MPPVLGRVRPPWPRWRPGAGPRRPCQRPRPHRPAWRCPARRRPARFRLSRRGGCPCASAEPVRRWPGRARRSAHRVSNTCANNRAAASMIAGASHSRPEPPRSAAMEGRPRPRCGVPSTCATSLSTAFDVARHSPCVDNFRCRVDGKSAPSFLPRTGGGRHRCRQWLIEEQILGCVPRAIPSLRTGLAACLHSLSTDLCTARLDDAARCHKTVGAIR